MSEYIRREDILNAVEKLDIIPSVDGMGIPTDTEDFRVQFLGTVLKVEPADVVPVVHAHWIDGYRWQTCSKCRNKGKRSWKICPNCGAKMDGKE